MAIVQGVAPHNGWLEVGGQRYQVISGSVTESTLTTTSTFRVELPLDAPGYLAAFAQLNGSTIKAKVIVLTHGYEATLMTADILKIEFQLVRGIICVSGDNGVSDFHEQKTTDTWTNKKGHEIAQDLAGRIGVPFSGIASKVMAGKKVKDDYIKLTDNISYWLTIHKLADMDHVRAYMDRDGTLQYRPPGTGGGYAVNWQQSTPQRPMVSDCLDLRITHNMLASDTQAATVSSFLPSEKKNVTSTVTVPGAGGGTRHQYETNPSMQQEQTFQRATALAQSGADHEWSLSATVVGDPSITASMSVSLSGSGFFDKSYPIDEVVHSFGIRGYTTQINAKATGSRSAQ